MASKEQWRFKRAVEEAKNASHHSGGQSDWKWSEAEQLEEYKYYKQATIGDVDALEPSPETLSEHAKWKAWQSLKGMSKEEASTKYIEFVELKNLSKPTTLQKLINEPKGKTTYSDGEAFLLHVLWVTPSMDAAKELLEGLRQCAHATHRDTPCVPTYFFHISSNDADLYTAPKTLGDHPQLRDAFKKLRVGTPMHAVTSDLQRRGLDPTLVSQDPSTPLPPALQQQPVVVECTELYLDERAFMEHMGSKDYLTGYGIALKPSLQNSQVTFRLGTPNDSIVSKILDPILKEVVVPLAEGCVVWNRAPPPVTCSLYFSLDFQASEDGAAVCKAVKDYATTCVTLPHPQRTNTTRLLCAMHSLPPQPVLQAIAARHPLRGEVYSPQHEQVRAALQASGLDMLVVNASEHVGYVLHDQAAALHL